MTPGSTIMYCQKCGAEILDESKGCEKCGNKIEHRQRGSGETFTYLVIIGLICLFIWALLSTKPKWYLGPLNLLNQIYEVIPFKSGLIAAGLIILFVILIWILTKKQTSK